MSQEKYQLALKAVQIYESQKVPAIFGPLAEATLARISLNDVDSLLDVACGTGIVARYAAAAFPHIVRISGVDLNQNMIAMANELTKLKPHLFKWYCADVVSLPIKSSSYRLAICQQGLQFVPEKQLVLEEIRRVLEPNGQLVLTVWSGISPLFAAIADALTKTIGQDVGEKSLTPFAFRNKAVIEGLVRAAGYKNMEVDELTVMRKIGPASESIPREVTANPVGIQVKAAGQETMDEIVRIVKLRLVDYETEEGYAIPQTTHIVIATV